jgi:hypothetical protein
MLNLIEPIAPVAVGAFKASLEMDKQIERWKRFKESAAYSKALAEFEIAQDPTRNS